MADQKGVGANDGGQKQERTNQAKIDEVQQEIDYIKKQDPKKTNIPSTNDIASRWAETVDTFTDISSSLRSNGGLLSSSGRVGMAQTTSEQELVKRAEKQRRLVEEKEAEEEKAKEEQAENRKAKKMTAKQRAEMEKAEKKKAKKAEKDKTKREKDKKLFSPLIDFFLNVTSKSIGFLPGLFANQPSDDPVPGPNGLSSESFNNLTPGPSGLLSASNSAPGPSCLSSIAIESSANSRLSQFYLSESTSNPTPDPNGYATPSQVYSSGSSDNLTPRPNSYSTRPTANLTPASSSFSINQPGSIANQSAAYLTPPQYYLSESTSNPTPDPSGYSSPSQFQLFGSIDNLTSGSNSYPVANLTPASSTFSGPVAYPDFPVQYPISGSQTCPRFPSSHSSESNAQFREQVKHQLEGLLVLQKILNSPSNSASEKSSSSNEELDKDNSSNKPTSQPMPSTSQSKPKSRRESPPTKRFRK